MHAMKKLILLSTLFVMFRVSGFSQSDKYWSANFASRSSLATDKAVSRKSYPSEFKLFNLNFASFKQTVLSAVQSRSSKNSTIISLPNADGNIEQFEIFEASNFEPALQAQFPEIRAFSGRGITDKSATLKLSLSPQGIQTMVFRTEKDNEFIEPYSRDHSVYSVYRSHRDKGKLPWSCTTEDKVLVSEIEGKVSKTNFLARSGGDLKTMRLAQSCNAEYSNYFGATSASQVSLVLAAFNATLTRCNGVYEKDLALHLNLIANTTSVIYYNPSTDPYSTTLSQWNAQLQSTLTSVIGEANYDIGHMFGASGGGGNAGCIGCVCTNGSKGSGITSPADAIPQGDNFDIDYVVHEVGHQLGANHTFSMSNEGTGVNKEIGSGITIMGYAGITSQDVANHSIDIFHEASIAQIQANLATKTCPITTSISATNATPVVAAVSNYTIPISTPFALTGSATDANASDVLTYCWEQNDNAGSTQTGASSVASATKATGPNWISFNPTTSPTRYFPKLATILAGAFISGPLTGGDAGANTEALSSVSRTLNFRLTVRDNAPYSSSAPVSVGQTSFTDMVVTVSNSSGPLAVTSPNTAVTWTSGSSAVVTWNVNGTTGAPVSCATVKISLSTDGGQTFPTVLAASTPNDGSETISVPSTPGTTCRVKVEAEGNIFFDISNTNFTIGAPAICADATGLSASSITETSATISWAPASGALNYDVDYKANTSSIWVNAATATTSTSVNLSGLTSNTLYDWRVRVNCSAGTGNYVQSQFTTAAPVSTCPGIYDVSNNGTTAGAALIPLNADIKGLINPIGDNDYYKFVINNGGTITISLTTLPANYQLDLLDGSGTLLQTSAKSGTNNETINATVTTGTYYARVYPRNNNQWNASICYTLKIQLGTASKYVGEELVTTSLGKVQVFPNPVRLTANFLFNSTKNGNTEITVINQLGSVVLSKIVTVNEENHIGKLDVSKLQNGLYYIKIKNGDTVETTKIIVSK